MLPSFVLPSPSKRVAANDILSDISDVETVVVVVVVIAWISVGPTAKSGYGVPDDRHSVLPILWITFNGSWRAARLPSLHLPAFPATFFLLLCILYIPG